MPADIDALFAEAGQHHQAGRFAEAETRLRQVAAAAPRHAPALHVLGVLCAQTGRPDEAVRWIEASLVIEPGNPVARFNLGNALSQAGRDEAAVTAYRASLIARPDFPPGWLNLATALGRAGRLKDAVGAYTQVIAMAPLHPVAHRGLGDTLRGLGRLDEAVSAYARALELDPANAAVCCNLGQTLQEAGRYDEALAAYRRALGMSLPSAEAWIALAGSFRELGETADALAATEKALARDPALPRAWYVKSGLKRFQAGDPDLARMEALLGEAEARGMAEAERIELAFALGKAWLDAGDADRGFAHLHAANRRKRATFDYDGAADVAQLAVIAAAEALASRAETTLGERAVLVVGLPRSGTTLVEQILASHPDIHGAGELTLLDEAIRVVMAGQRGRPNATRAAQIGRRYLDGLAQIAPEAARVVDKLPANLRHAGLIQLALPGARIIHCRRDLADTCLSLYEHNFVEGVDFAYDLAEAAGYARASERLATHWRSALPADRWLDVDYEALVDDLDGQARRLIAFVGLPWNDACLDFHATRRDIRTASATQARQPLYASSVGRAKRYAAHLAPLFEALNVGD